ncbi:3008_t:CDS:2, partial [Gigaspora margarita]
DLESVHHKIVLLVESQAREIHTVISSQHIRVQHVHRSFFFEPLLYHVSVFALNKIHDILIKVLSATPDSPLKPCTVDPSHHVEFLKPTNLVNNDHTNLELLLQSLTERYQFWLPYQQASIYSQIEELVSTLPIMLENPITKKPQERPVGTGNKNKKTTQRDLFAFEHVEKWSRQHGTCHQPGHNSRTCLNTDFV